MVGSETTTLNVLVFLILLLVNAMNTLEMALL